MNSNPLTPKKRKKSKTKTKKLIKARGQAPPQFYPPASNQQFYNQSLQTQQYLQQAFHHMYPPHITPYQQNNSYPGAYPPQQQLVNQVMYNPWRHQGGHAAAPWPPSFSNSQPLVPLNSMGSHMMPQIPIMVKTEEAASESSYDTETTEEDRSPPLSKKLRRARSKTKKLTPWTVASSTEYEYDSDSPKPATSADENEEDNDSVKSKVDLKSFAVVVGHEAMKVAPKGSGRVPTRRIKWKEVAKSFPEMSVQDCKNYWKRNFKNHHFARVDFGLVLMCSEGFLRKACLAGSGPTLCQGQAAPRNDTSDQYEPHANVQTNSNNNNTGTGTGTGTGSGSGGSSNDSKKRKVPKFSPAEEVMIGRLRKRLGSDWGKIAEKLGTGKTASQIKTYWKSHNKQPGEQDAGSSVSTSSSNIN